MRILQLLAGRNNCRRRELLLDVRQFGGRRSTASCVGISGRCFAS